MVIGRLIAVMTLLLASGGCGSRVTRRACMGGDAGTSPLFTSAERLRVDVYGAAAGCDEKDAGTAPMTLEFTRGAPIVFDLPAGPHTMVVTTYSDTAGTLPLGRGCTEAMLTPGAQVCFDVTLTDLRSPSGDMPPNLDLGLPDGGAPPADMSHPNDMSGSVDMAHPSDMSGSVDMTPTDMACCQPIHGTCLPDCTLACDSGYGDCDGDHRTGCETHTAADVDHCGACTRACSSSHVASRSCTNGLCDSTCASGYLNCTQPAAGSPPYTADDGCESPAHSNGPTNWGLGQTYCDPHPLGSPNDESTYTESMANAARAAAPAGTDQSGTTCTGGARCVGRTIGSYCYVWCYENGSGYTRAGHVYRYAGGGCACPVSTDPTWN